MKVIFYILVATFMSTSVASVTSPKDAQLPLLNDGALHSSDQQTSFSTLHQNVIFSREKENNRNQACGVLQKVQESLSTIQSVMIGDLDRAEELKDEGAESCALLLESHSNELEKQVQALRGYQPDAANLGTRTVTAGADVAASLLVFLLFAFL